MINQLFHSDTELFPLFGGAHILLFVTVCLLVFLSVKGRKYILQPLFSMWLRVILLITIFIQQVLLYSWYYFNDAFDVVDALPLYPCRISSLLLFFMLISYQKNLFHVLFYWGIIGPILAFISPDTNNLGFPNAMFIQYVIGHIAIIIGVIYLAIIHHYKPTWQGLKKCFIYSLIYFAAIIGINEWLGSNYAYLKEKPPMDFLSFIPGFPFHIPIIIGLMFFLFYLFQLIYQNVHKMTRTQKRTLR